MIRAIRNKTILGAFGLVLAFCSRCTTEESPDLNTRISFHLKSPYALDGKITIDEAYLKVSRIEVRGSLQGERNTNIIQNVSPEEPPYQLTDAGSREINLRLPPAMYDQLVFNLVLNADTYQLVMNNAAAGEPADQPGNDDTTTDGGESGGQPAEGPDQGAGNGAGENEDNGGGGGDENDDNDTGDDHDGAGETDSGEDEGEDGNTPEHQGDDHHKDDHQKEDKGDKHNKFFNIHCLHLAATL